MSGPRKSAVCPTCQREDGDELVITLREMAQTLKRSERQIRQWKADGLFDSCETPFKHRYSRKKFEELINGKAFSSWRRIA